MNMIETLRIPEAERVWFDIGTYHWQLTTNRPDALGTGWIATTVQLQCDDPTLPDVAQVQAGAILDAEKRQLAAELGHERSDRVVCRNTLNVPVPFPGTEEERRANFATHTWVSYDPEEPEECGTCASRAYHVAADYPCGIEPPRMTLR